MPLSFQYYGYAISVVVCTKVIYLIALYNWFGFWTIPLGFLHTCDWDSPPFQHVGNFSALAWHCTEIDSQEPHPSSSFDLLLYPQPPIMGEPLLSCHCNTWAGVWRVAYRGRPSIISILWRCTVHDGFEFACGFLQPAGTIRQHSSFLSRACDRLWQFHILCQLIVLHEVLYNLL